MKTFWHIVGIWFLIQIVIIGAGVAKNSASAANAGQTEAQYVTSQGTDKIDPALAFLLGATMPLVATTLVSAEWSWQN